MKLYIVCTKKYSTIYIMKRTSDIYFFIKVRFHITLCKIDGDMSWLKETAHCAIVSECMYKKFLTFFRVIIFKNKNLHSHTYFYTCGTSSIIRWYGI